MPPRDQRPDLLIVDDDETVRQLLEIQARQYGFRPEAFEDGETAMGRVKEVADDLDVVLLDLRMPGWSGIRCLEHLHEHHPMLPAVVLSSAGEVPEAVQAMKLGAVDYVTKPFDPDELFAALRNARRMRRAERENESLREAFGGTSPDTEMVARSEVMQDVASKARKVAKLDSTVLLLGESGVGKGVLARMIHRESGRAGGPFVTVSCPALPRELLESELFGHERGAFTGAAKRRIGKVEAARGGTLFLDEIGDLPLDLQPKLLNVLQDREFQRVGGESVLEADVRVIAATNVDLEEQVAAGEFREDLFYRLNVIPLEIPPLRERLADIEALSGSILGRIGADRGTGGLQLAPETVSHLQTYDWPGNVRQLENVLERASAFCEGGTIAPDDLPASIRGGEVKQSGPAGIGGIPLAELEHAALVQTLELCKGNKAETARRLGVTEKSVYNKMKRHGLM